MHRNNTCFAADVSIRRSHALYDKADGGFRGLTDRFLDSPAASVTEMSHEVSEPVEFHSVKVSERDGVTEQNTLEG